MSEKMKSKAAAAGWHLLRTEHLFENAHFRLRRDRVRIGATHEIDFTYFESKGAVWIVPVTPEGHIVLIRQYRYAVDDWLWEVPAGGLFDHDGDPESLARRELEEEVGGTAEQMQYLGWFYGGAAMTDTRCHLFLARNTRLTLAPRHELSETIEIHTFPPAEALGMARNGVMRDGRSALALLWSEPYLWNTRPGGPAGSAVERS